MTDALFHLGSSPPTGFGGFLLRLMGSIGSLNITKIGRKLLLTNEEAFATYLEKLSEVPNLSILSMAHGTPIRHDVQAELMSASKRVRR